VIFIYLILIDIDSFSVTIKLDYNFEIAEHENVVMTDEGYGWSPTAVNSD